MFYASSVSSARAPLLVILLPFGHQCQPCFATHQLACGQTPETKAMQTEEHHSMTHPGAWHTTQLLPLRICHRAEECSLVGPCFLTLLANSVLTHARTNHPHRLSFAYSYPLEPLWFVKCILMVAETLVICLFIMHSTQYQIYWG